MCFFSTDSVERKQIMQKDVWKYFVYTRAATLTFLSIVIMSGERTAIWEKHYVWMVLNVMVI